MKKFDTGLVVSSDTTEFESELNDLIEGFSTDGWEYHDIKYSTVLYPETETTDAYVEYSALVIFCKSTKN